MKPELFQTLSQFLIAVGIISTAIGGWGAYYFGKKVDGLKDAAAEKRELVLHDRVGALVEGSERLEERLKPFEELAEKVYPSIERDAALGRLLREFEELKKRASDLELQATPRRLDQHQEQQLSEALRLAGNPTVTITAVMGDQEASQFAEDLKGAIESAGWTVSGVNQAMYGGPVLGLIIGVGADPPPPAVNILYRSLRALGFDVNGNLHKKKEPAEFELIIGSKQ